jgi:hypothetical protein
MTLLEGPYARFPSIALLVLLLFVFPSIAHEFVQLLEMFLASAGATAASRQPPAATHCGTAASSSADLAVLAMHELRAADAQLGADSETAAELVAALREGGSGSGLPSLTLLDWLVGLRNRAADAMESIIDSGRLPCRIISVTVGFYEVGAEVSEDRRFPIYEPFGEGEAGCGVAFANAAFLDTLGELHKRETRGWLLVPIETELGDSLPFRSASHRNDLQRVAHMVKTAAPLLFPCASLIFYCDTKGSVYEASPQQKGRTESRRVFPFRQMLENVETFHNSPLVVLQHPSHFGRPLRLEFTRTWTHMQLRHETEPVFTDISRLETLLMRELDVHVPMIDAICLAYRTNITTMKNRAQENGQGNTAAMRFSLIWTALVEGFSMREQLSYNAAAGLTFSQAGSFFRYPQEGGWQQPSPQVGVAEAPAFDTPWEAEGITYVPFEEFFNGRVAKP